MLHIILIFLNQVLGYLITPYSHQPNLFPSMSQKPTIPLICILHVVCTSSRQKAQSPCNFDPSLPSLTLGRQQTLFFSSVELGRNRLLLSCMLHIMLLTCAMADVVHSTQLLLADPKRFLTLAGSSERYIGLLRQVAAHYSTFSNALKKRMRDAPFILGFEQVQSEANKPLPQREEDDDVDGLLQYRLGLATEIVIIDDTTSLNDFREYILSCPQDDLIEAFVEQLGGRRISKLVNTNFSSTVVPEASSPRSVSLRKLVLEVNAPLKHIPSQLKGSYPACHFVPSRASSYKQGRSL